MIYQVQGISIDLNVYTVTGGNGTYTVQNSLFSNGNIPDFIEFGSVTNYKSTGLYELAEVQSVSGANTINLTCGLQHSYLTTDNNHPQVIRVPRFRNLTVPNNTSITPIAWDGTVGGVVAIEVEEDLSVTGSGRISADSLGFRGGLADGTPTAAPVAGSINNVGDRGFLGSFSNAEGAEKGEGIYGGFIDHDIVFSRFCYGSIANGGGGANYHNAGGGGGANVGQGTYYGYGVIDRGPGNAYDPAWNLEDPAMITNIPTSAGGGRGGYSHASVNRNELTVGPHNNLWDSDYRRISGGVGGHPLTYDANRAFLGGGGGGGHQNNGEGGDGGNGGGFVFVSVYGNTTGDGFISANGQDGGDASGSSSLGWWDRSGDDGAGGAGGGGAVVIRNINPLPATLKLEAIGGKGGDQIRVLGLLTSEIADGPGGGGAGGMIAFTSGTPQQDVSGGLSGVTNSSFMTNFPVNGATGGADGLMNRPTVAFDILVENDTICSGESTTLTATTAGNLSPTPTLYWYSTYTGGSAIAVGNSMTTPALSSTTTYYVGGTCPNSFRVPVTVVVAPDIIIAGTPPTITDETCAGNDGSITGITASGGGFGTLTYEWNGNPTPSADLTGATAGTYTLGISDEVGCSETLGPFTIGNASGPTIDASAMTINDESCTGNDGSITGITASGGTGTLTYDWNGTASPTPDLTGAVSGTYTLTVSDGNGCTATSGPQTINSASSIAIDVTAMTINDESCNGNDGSITGITASGGTGTLTYSWSPSGATTADLTAVPNGSYTLTVTDGSGCTATSGPHTINQIAGPTYDDSGINTTAATCGNNNGSITGITTTGTGLTYAWSPSGATTLDATNLASGAHTLTITDGAGCVISAGPYNITAAGGPTLDASGLTISDETCNGNDGSITGITVSGGTRTLTYDWNGTASPTPDLTGAVGGTYTLTVTDGNGCTDVVGPYTIVASPGPAIDASGLTISDETCTGNDGSITGITASGGTGTLTYDWNGTASPTPDLTGAVSGTYTLTVTDGNGCTATSGPHTINSASSIAIDVTAMTINDESCNGNDGSITGITASGGTGTLTYSWSPSGATTADLTAVPNGSYTLTVTDGSGCTATSGPHTINQIAGPTYDDSGINITAATCGNNNGSITGITTTGTGLTYAWSPSGATTLDVANLPDGVHTLTITDGAGCTVTTSSYTVSTSPNPVIDASNASITDASCAGGDGGITGITLTGGTAPFTYTWNGTVTPSTDLLNVGAGTYVLTVTDGNGCTDVVGPFTIIASPGPAIDASGLTISDETCTGNDGSITGITASGGTGTLTYDWNGTASPTPDLTGAVSGTYTLTVTDGNGCTATSGPHTINSASSIAIDVTAMTINDESCNGNDGSITGITASGGTGTLTYSWSPSGATTADLTAVPNGSYTLTVTDGSGCTATSGPHTINQIAGPTYDDSGINIT